MNFKAWDEAIAARLQPVREQLIGVPVAALPKEAGKFGAEQFESIDWLFPSYQALDSELGDRVQTVTVTLSVRLYFKKRYPEGLEKDALEWAEGQILKLLAAYWLPEAITCLRLVSGKLFAPTQGQWYKELDFSFDARLDPGVDSAIAPVPLVETIGVDDQHGQLVKVVKEFYIEPIP